MKIIHIEDFFHPDAGYQVNILSKYMVKQGHQVFVLTSELKKIPEYLTGFFGRENIIEKDKEFTACTGVKIIRVPIKQYVSGRSIYGKELYETVEELLPDILFVHGNDSVAGIRYTMRLSKLSYPIVLDSHMLEMASQNPFNRLFRYFYKTFVTPIIIGNNLKVIRTQDDDYVERCLGIPLSQAPWISVGSDTDLFHPDEQVKQLFRDKYNIANDDFVIVYTGKLDEAKGGIFLANSFLKKLENKKNKNVVLIVVGNSVGQYGKEVEEIFSNSENRILRFKTQKYMDLAKFYQAADLSVFPKQCSLSFYDAQACGLPVVLEDNNINIDRLRFSNGFNFKANNTEDFRNKIKLCCEFDKNKYEVMRQNATRFVQENYNYDYIAQQYTDLLENEIMKFHQNH